MRQLEDDLRRASRNGALAPGTGASASRTTQHHGDHLRAVAWVHGPVRVAMEDDRAHGLRGPQRAERCCAGVASRSTQSGPSTPLFVTASASIRLRAEPRDSPECTPTAANISDYAAATMSAIAPPADSPAM